MRALRTASAALLLAASLPGAAEAQHRPSASVVWAGAAGGALVGAFLLDETVRDAWAYGDPAGFEWLSSRLNPLGKPKYSVLGLGALYVGGRAAGSRGVSDAAWHTLAALAASGVANGTLKYTVGRARPHRERGHAAFEPFNLDDHWQAFPSGHTTVVFSLAASAAEEADRPWVSVVSYGTAAMVGWSRIYEDKHWISDVVGGVVVGIATSKATLHWLHSREAGEESGGGGGVGAVRVALSPSGIVVRVPTR